MICTRTPRVAAAASSVTATSSGTKYAEPSRMLSRAEATPERFAVLLKEHPGVVVVDGEASHVLTRGRGGDAVPAASIDAGSAIGQCFPLLAAHDALVVTQGGAVAGILTREMAFKALARSARAA